ncbi:putative disease resistance protein RGA4 [Pistacia vera]|uniref:putative disease resistance protein RGA4 n=1 Tax=Pistacia vera TaxID=55513 RepID=UPI0012633A73|nr:putative disease resistance protein RGA4 [Pistacia vera]
MASEIVPYVWKRFSSLIFVQDTHRKVLRAAGVRKEVEKIAKNFKDILAVLPDAQAREMQEQKVRDWLDKVKNISYDMNDAFDEYSTLFLKLQIVGDEHPLVKKKVCFFFLAPRFFFAAVNLCHRSAVMIKKINENLDDIVNEKHDLSLNASESTEKQIQITSSSDLNEINSENEKEKILVSKLLGEGSSLISIMGMKEEGKTLVQSAYNNNEVIKNFSKRIWVNILGSEDKCSIKIEVSEGKPISVGYDVFNKTINQHIKDEKFLLVLNDMRIEDFYKLESVYFVIDGGIDGSKILIITSDERSDAFRIISDDIIMINELSGEENWSMFSKLAFSGRSIQECESLKEIGQKIVSRCLGLPLAIQIMGSMLRFKTSIQEWERILDNKVWTLEESKVGFLPVFFLSYYDLPSMVRLCFIYCAIFPKGYSMNKDKLIKLWMAQGYLGLEPNIEMEILGQRYFNHLVTRSFFQDFEKDDNGDITSCKINGLMHDFAKFLNRNECIEINDSAEEPSRNSVPDKVFHLMLMLKKSSSSVPNLNAKRLRTLFISCEDDYYHLDNDILQQLFGNLARVRALKFDVFVREIPTEIGKLIQLRYLDLSGQQIKKLPETLCQLYNLQSLDITWCDELEELPQAMGKLINLRHLINDYTYSLSYMPVGIGRLTHLRTLSEFIVSGAGNGTPDSKACCLESLKDLNRLRGKLVLRGLGNVRNVSEVVKMELKNKKILSGLGVLFDEDEEEQRINHDESLLKALQPPPNLEKLDIQFYRGSTFHSNWVMSLTSLRHLRLKFCINCKHLSPFGELHSLESLRIRKISSVKRVDDKFWGIESDGRSSSSSSSILFPKLKYLKFSDMKEWEEWDFKIIREGEEKECITFMPCLASLEINFCGKLKALPDDLLQRITLKKLELYGCPVLTQYFKKRIEEHWPKINQISTIKIDGEYVRGGPDH